MSTEAFSLSDAWGYGAVTIPKLLFWQGFKIIDPQAADQKNAVHDLIVRAETAVAQFAHRLEHEVTIEGLLGAGMAEMFFRALKSGGLPGGLRAHASAFSKVAEHRFWIVDADISDHGTATVHTFLDVTSSEAARDEINRRMATLKMGQMMKSLMKAGK